MNRIHPVSVRGVLKKAHWLLLSALPLVVGCATSMQAPVKEVDVLKTNEGRVVGSVLINVPLTKDESSWAWLKGSKAEKYSYRFDIEPADAFHNPFFRTSRIYTIEAGVGQEEVFVTNLPTGPYRFNRLTQKGGSFFYGDIDRTFNVSAGQTTYIGRLIVEFPERLEEFRRFVIRVEDLQEEALQAAKAKTGIVLTNVVNALIR
jgi:hypothetical protein